MFIFEPKTGTPPIAAKRMQRWAATLTAYNYTVPYRKSQEHADADATSRLPQLGHSILCEQTRLYQPDQYAPLPVTFSTAAQKTTADILLTKVH